MKIATEEDVKNINRIMNHPDVRPWVYDGDGELDFTGLTKKLHILTTDHAVAIGEHLGGNEYIAVLAVEPQGRGLDTISLFYDLMDHMFFATDAIRIYGTIHPDNKRSLDFFKLMGAHVRVLGDRYFDEWNFVDWAFKSKRAMRTGLQADGVLDMDLATKKMFGAFLLTVRGGWAGKAYHIFNKYAYLAMKPTIRVCDPDWPIS